MSELDVLKPGTALLFPFDRRQLLDYIPKKRRAAEIGVMKGAYSREILRRARPSQLILVDAWDLDIDHATLSIPNDDRYTPRSFARLSKIVPAYLRIRRPFSNFRSIRSLSVPAAGHFPDGHFDWIYIDADHSYEGTIADLRAWAPKVRPDGLILGHDFRDRKGFGVIRAVKEFTAESGFRLIGVTTDPWPSFVLCREMTGVAAAFLSNVFGGSCLYRVGIESLLSVRHRRHNRPGRNEGIVSILN